MNRLRVPGGGRLSGVVVLLAVLVALAAVLVTGSQDRTPTDEQRAQQIAEGLRCPVCKDLSAADSPAPLARQMRAQILEEVRAGDSAAEIRQGFVEAYGASVLMSPPNRGWGRVAHLLPFLVAGVALLAGAGVLRAARRSTYSHEPHEPSTEDRALVDRALEELLQEER